MKMKPHLLFLALLAPLLLCAQQGASSCAELQTNYQQYQSCATSVPFTNSTGNTSGETFTTTCIGEPFQGPTWFFMKIKTSGDIVLQIRQNASSGALADVDFVLWGPFADLNNICSQLTPAKEVDCSWSPNGIEIVHLDDAVAGQLYILLVDNYENVRGEITISQTGGDGSSDCSFLSDIEILDTTGNEITQFDYCKPATKDLVATADTSDFTGNPGDLRFNYTWYRNEVVVATATDVTTATHTFTASETGVYRVKMTAYDVTDPPADPSLLVVSEAEIALTFYDAPQPSVTATSQCLADAPLLQASNTLPSAEPVSYRWYRDGAPVPGATSATYSPTQDGTYWVRAGNPGCAEVDSASIVIFSTTLTAFDPDLLEACDDSGHHTFDLTARQAQMAGPSPLPDLRFTYYESLADAAAGSDDRIDDPSAFTNTSPGYQKIYVRLDSDASLLCHRILEQELFVRHSPDDNLRKTPYHICVDKDGTVVDPVVIDTGLSDDFQFTWFDGFGAVGGNELPTNQSFFVARTPGDYSVRIVDYRYATLCSIVIDFTVRNTEVPFSVTASPDRQIAFVTENTITATALPASEDYEYQLNDNGWQQSPVFVDVKEGVYRLTVRSKFGCGSVWTEVVVADYPRYFTPNGDGIHDTWNIDGQEAMDLSIVFIFDKSGRLLKSIFRDETGWDGTYDGRPMPADDYWFLVEYVKDGVPGTFRGHFALKR